MKGDALGTDPYVRIVGADVETAISEALAAAGCGVRGPDRAGEYTSNCPAHPDERASLRWRVSIDGRGLLMCQAGCEYNEIVEALGLPKWRMYPTQIEYDYYEADGTYAYTVIRKFGADGGKGFSFGTRGDSGMVAERGDARDMLWRLPDLTEWSKTTRGGTLYLPEGEHDAAVVGWALGLSERDDARATSAPGGARKWSADLTSDVARVCAGGAVSRLVILCDRDPAGIRRGQSLSIELSGALGQDVAVSVLTPREGTGKDVAELIDRYGLEGWEGRLVDASGSEMALIGVDGSLVSGGITRTVEPASGRTVLAYAKAKGDPVPLISGDLEVTAWWSTEPGSDVPSGWELEVRPLVGRRRTVTLTVKDLSDPSRMRRWLIEVAGIGRASGSLGIGDVGDSMVQWLRWQTELTRAPQVVAAETVGWIDVDTGKPASVATERMVWADESGGVVVASGDVDEIRVRSIGGKAPHCRWGAEGSEVDAAWALARVMTFADPEVVAVTVGWAAATILGPWLAQAGIPIRPGLAVVAPSGSGKAQPLSAPVMTSSGWQTMGDLGVGSEVIGSDGRATRVTGVYPQGEQDIYRVWFDDGAYADVTGDHLWLTQTDLDRRAWGGGRKGGGRPGAVRTTLEIAESLRSKRGARNHSIPLVSAADGHLTGADLPIGPYALGVLLGDGTFHEESITLSSTDQQILDDFLTDVGDDRVRLTHCASANDWDYGVRGDGRVNPVLRAIKELGLARHRSYEKYVPEVYKYGSVATRLEVLRGLMDTDGWSGPSAEFGTSSERLAADVRDIVWSLGGTARLRTKKTRTGRTCYTVVIRLTQCPFRLERKAAAWRARRRRPLARLIDRVELIGREEAQCIRVEAADSLYVTSGWALTHNTTGAVGLILGLAGCTGPLTTSRAAYRRLLQSGVGTIRWLDDSDLVEDPGMKELLRVATTRSDHVLAAADVSATATEGAELTGSPVVSAEGVRWLEETAMTDRFALVSPPNPQGRMSVMPGREGRTQWEDVVELTREWPNVSALAGHFVRGVVAAAVREGDGDPRRGLQKWIDESGGARGRKGSVQAAVCAGTAAVASWLKVVRTGAGKSWPGRDLGPVYTGWKWLRMAADEWRTSALSETASTACSLTDIVIPRLLREDAMSVNVRGRTPIAVSGITATDADSFKRCVIDAVTVGEVTMGLPALVTESSGAIWISSGLAALQYQRAAGRYGASEARLVSEQAITDQVRRHSDDPEWAVMETRNGEKVLRKSGARIGGRGGRVVYHRLTEAAAARVRAVLES